MATLPSAESLRDVRAPAGSPGISVPTISYSDLATSGARIGVGLEKVGHGLTAVQAAQDQADKIDTESRLAYFRLDADKAFAEHSQTMQPGGAGFSQSWEKTYNRMANQFFGQGGENIPASQRKTTDFALVKLNEHYLKSARSTEDGERQKAAIGRFQNAAKQWADSTEQYPDAYDANLTDMRAALAGLRLSPAQQEAAYQSAQQLLTKARVDGLVKAGRSDEAAAAAKSFDQSQQERTRTRSYADAISGIESGGRYDLVGPPTRSGDRAFGKYQVMGENVGPWTREVLGQAMTPQEFLADPQAQEAVFQAKFGQYVQKYGPAGAAKAWFAGERGMNNPNAKDALGTTVAEYERRFTAAAGGEASPTEGGTMQLYAKTLIEKRNDSVRSALALERFRVEALLKSDLQSTAATGQDVANLDLAKIEKTIGPVAFAKYKAEKQVTHEVWANTHDLYGLNDAAIAQRLDALTPKPGAPDFAQRQAVYDSVQAQISAVRKQRLDDPAGSVAPDPQVRAAQQAYDPQQPQTMAALAQARMAAQRRAGIPEDIQSPITKDEAKQALSTLRMAAAFDEASPPVRGQESRLVTQQKALIESLRTSYGAYANAAMLTILRQATGGDRGLADAAGEVLGSLLSGRAPGAPATRRLAQAQESAAAAKAMPSSPEPAPHSDLYGVDTSPPPPKRWPMPPYAAQLMLFERPETAAQFDEIFGPGAAERTLALRAADQRR